MAFGILNETRSALRMLNSVDAGQDHPSALMLNRVLGHAHAVAGAASFAFTARGLECSSEYSMRLFISS